MAAADLREAYEKFLAAPFPGIGADVGLFPAYDGYVAGYAQRAIGGEAISASIIPEPDSEIALFVERLRSATFMSPEEAEFLAYFDLLERVIGEISDDPVDILVPLLDEGTDVWVLARGKRLGPRHYEIIDFELPRETLRAQEVTLAFDLGATVAVAGGDPTWEGGSVVGVTRRIAVARGKL